jgi:hypothetical protein
MTTNDNKIKISEKPRRKSKTSVMPNTIGLLAPIQSVALFWKIPVGSELNDQSKLTLRQGAILTPITDGDRNDSDISDIGRHMTDTIGTEPVLAGLIVSSTLIMPQDVLTAYGRIGSDCWLIFLWAFQENKHRFIPTDSDFLS